MSVLEDLLKEEYERSLRVSAAMERELTELPRGSVQRKVINGYQYYYLQFREGDKIKSNYIGNDEVDDIREKVKRRKSLEQSLKEQEKNRKQIEKALGKEAVRE